jgi:hypothetical protein
MASDQRGARTHAVIQQLRQIVALGRCDRRTLGRFGDNVEVARSPLSLATSDLANALEVALEQSVRVQDSIRIARRRFLAMRIANQAPRALLRIALDRLLALRTK